MLNTRGRRWLGVLLVLLISSLARADTQQDFTAAYRAYQQYTDSGNASQALESASEAYRLGAKLYGKKSVSAAKLGINYATLLNDGGEFRRARRVLKGKLEIMEGEYGSDAVELVSILIELGRANFDLREPEGGLAYFDRTIGLLTNHKNPMYRGKKNFDIASILLRRQGSAFTRKYIEAAHAVYAEHLQPNDVRLGLTSYHMALWSVADEDHATAIDYLLASLGAFKTDDGKMQNLERTARTMLVAALENTGQSELATEHCIALGRDLEWTTPVRPVFSAVDPVLPEGARANALSGEVVLAFTIDEQGFVRNPSVTSSSVPAFDGPVVEMVSQFRYAPRFADGNPVATEDVSFAMSFDFSQRRSSRFRIPPPRGSGGGGGGDIGFEPPGSGGRGGGGAGK